MAKVKNPIKDFWESDKKSKFLKITKKAGKDGAHIVSINKADLGKKVKKQKNIKEDFFFDDCLICQATRKAEKEGVNLSSVELKKVFEKANNKKNNI